MIPTLDLFAGIGGFAHGLEQTGGFKTAAFCEIEPYARAVLKKHWPEVPCYDDVRTVTHARLRGDGIHARALTAGFPCQDISLAGKGAGLGGARSGLWFEVERIVREHVEAGEALDYVILENVSALRSRGLDVVLGGLAALGYDAEWHCVPASAVGAPHRRDRVWIIAYPGGEQHQGGRDAQRGTGTPGLSEASAPPDQRRTAHDALRGRHRIPEGQICAGWDCAQHADWWAAEPDVGRVADGVPSRVDRLRALGNAVVPQIPQMIGEAILTREFLS